MNDNGNSVGYKYVKDGDTTKRYLMIWDKNGKGSIVTDPHLIGNNFTVDYINNQNTIVGTMIYEDIPIAKPFTFTENKVYSEYTGFPYDKSNMYDSHNYSKVNNSLGENYKKIFNSNGKSRNSVFTWFFMDASIVNSINNDGDMVGFSNYKPVIWLKEKPQAIDLSPLLSTKVKEGGLIAAEIMNISDRQNGIVKLAVTTYDSVYSTYFQKLYVIDYSVTEKKILSKTLIDLVDGVKLFGGLPSKLLNDGTLISSFGFLNEKPSEYGLRVDGYITSPKNNYGIHQNISPIFKKYGYNSPLIYFDAMNSKFVGIGTYVMIDQGFNQKYFLIDYTNNSLTMFNDMLTNGDIVGFTVDNNYLYPNTINENGEILVNATYSTGEAVNNEYAGKLIPVK